MSRPAYADIADALLELDDLGKYLSIFRQLRDNAAAARIQVLGVNMAEDTTVNTTFEAHAEYVFTALSIPDIADYPSIQRLLSVKVAVKTAGGATGTYRLKDSASGNTSAEVTTTSATYEDKTLTLNIDAAWKGTDRVIILEMKTSSGANAAYAKADKRYDAYLEF